MTSSSCDILHNNQIYYQFKNEKRKNSLILEESEKDQTITVNEIKQKIAKDLKEKQKVTNLDFDIIIYGENANNRMNESEQISNGQTLIIERVPWYKLGMTSEADKNKEEINANINKQRKYYYYNIEKIFDSVNDTDKLLRVLNENIIKSFTCKFCGRFEDDLDYFMTKCCGETGCKKCLLGIYDKNNEYFTLLNLQNKENDIINKNINNGEDNFSNNIKYKNLCPLCSTEINCIGKYIMPNKKINELKEFLNELKNIKCKKTNLKINLDKPNITIGPDKFTDISENKQNASTSNTTPTSLMKLTPSNYLQAGINLIYNSNNSNYNQNGINDNCHQVNYLNNSNYNPNDQIIYSLSNPHFPFFENSRFFIIKSYCKENIEISQLHNEWATTVANQKKLNESFKDKNVVLIFSANKSGIFQGYAIMKNYIGDKTSDIWNLDYSVKIGGNFKVHWLCSCEFPFAKLKHLTNPLNNNEPLIKSRDTQELTKELGIQVCHLLYEQEKIKSGVKPIYDNSSISDILDGIKKNREKGNYDLITKKLSGTYGQEFTNNNSILPISRKSSLDEKKSKNII
jgi:hypothetical protein